MQNSKQQNTDNK